MTITEIKNDLQSHVGRDAIINCNMGRNKYEKYDVVIKELYDYIFLVEDRQGAGVKSFSYTDVITKTIKIDYSNSKKE